MNKIFKDEKIFNKFKKQFKSIFKDETFKTLLDNHFNKNGSFVVFVFAFLQNRINPQRIIDNARINKDEWINLFSELYSDQEIQNAYEQLSLNPIITYENIKKHFVVFDGFIKKLYDYINEHNWNIAISKNEFVEMFTCVYGYYLYNDIECKLNWKLSDILQDKDYDKKYTMILNNTKLFAEAKACILKHCGLKINDLIVILLGGSNHLALDK